MEDDQNNVDEKQGSLDDDTSDYSGGATVTHFLALLGSYQERMARHLQAKNSLKSREFDIKVAKRPVKDFWGEDIPATEALLLSPIAFTVFMMIYGHETEKNDSPLTEEELIKKVLFKADISPAGIKNTLKQACNSGLLSKAKGELDGRQRVYSCSHSLRQLIEDVANDAIEYTGSQPI